MAHTKYRWLTLNIIAPVAPVAPLAPVAPVAPLQSYHQDDVSIICRFILYYYLK